MGQRDNAALGLGLTMMLLGGGSGWQGYLGDNERAQLQEELATEQVSSEALELELLVLSSTLSDQQVDIIETKTRLAEAINKGKVSQAAYRKAKAHIDALTKEIAGKEAIATLQLEQLKELEREFEQAESKLREAKKELRTAWDNARLAERNRLREAVRNAECPETVLKSKSKRAECVRSVNADLALVDTAFHACWTSGGALPTYREGSMPASIDNGLALTRGYVEFCDASLPEADGEVEEPQPEPSPPELGSSAEQEDFEDTAVPGPPPLQEEEASQDAETSMADVTPGKNLEGPMDHFRAVGSAIIKPN